MIYPSIGEGFRLSARRPGLTVLLFLINVVAALILSVPVYFAVQSAVGETGFGSLLVERFDIVLWTDIVEDAGDVLGSMQVQLVWMVPFFLLWKAASGVGLVNALRSGGIRSFWEGVGRYTGKAVVVGLLFLVMVSVWIGLVVLLTVIATMVWSDPNATFWLAWIVAPSTAVVGIALIDLMHDYGRIHLVCEERSIIRSWIEGIKFPFRRPGAFVVYACWLIAAGILSFAIGRLHPSWGASMGTVWGLFLGQQLLLFLRAGVSVAWYGSEVSLFERIRFREAPLIADEGVPTGSPTGGMGLETPRA